VSAWLAYAAAGGLLTLAGAALGSRLVPPEGMRAVWFAAALVYALQLAAFAALIAVRERKELFVIGWLGGLVARFAAVGAVAFWLSREPVFPLETTLVSMVSFVFVLLLLEPLFLRRGLQTR
jgi:hypothetical protein